MMTNDAGLFNGLKRFSVSIIIVWHTCQFSRELQDFFELVLNATCNSPQSPIDKLSVSTIFCSRLSVSKLE